jgi:hypothetical protein
MRIAALILPGVATKRLNNLQFRCCANCNCWHDIISKNKNHSLAQQFIMLKLGTCYVFQLYTTIVRPFLQSLNPLTLELNPSMQRCLTRFLLGILLLEPCISLIYAWKTNRCNNYSFSLLIMYGSSYMFRHYIAILRECS